jgi:hypothetical protein
MHATSCVILNADEEVASYLIDGCGAGEMVFPWMFEDFVELRPVREAANILAEESNWPPLYDLNVLQRNTIPIAAACYYDDM